MFYPSTSTKVTKVLKVLQSRKYQSEEGRKEERKKLGEKKSKQGILLSFAGSGMGNFHVLLYICEPYLLLFGLSLSPIFLFLVGKTDKHTDTHSVGVNRCCVLCPATTESREKER